MSNPHKWSLRTRLLAGLIAITATFLVVMGVVSAIVLGNLDEDQFSTDLGLTAKESLADIATATSGYGAAYFSARKRTAGLLDFPPPSRASLELEAWLNQLGTKGSVEAEYRANPPPDQFTVSMPGYPVLTVTFR